MAKQKKTFTHRGHRLRVDAVKTLVAENDLWRPKLWIDGSVRAFSSPYPPRSFKNEADAIEYAEEYGKWTIDNPPSSGPSALDELLKDNGQVSWLVELMVKPNQLANFRVLTGEMVESARGETGVLSYERFVSDDGTFVYAYERYADSAAALAHLKTFQKKFSGRFLEMVERRRFTVFGTPTDELRAVLDRFGATYLRPFGDSNGREAP